jgi:hypothetical protein
MDALVKMLEEIYSNYDVRFIIEQVQFDQEKPVFRLKRRKVVKFFGRVKYMDEYELNSISKRINFKSVKDIEMYLRFQFSEPEGFMTNVFDLSQNDND